MTAIWELITTFVPCDVADVTVRNNGLVCTLTNRPLFVQWRRLHKTEVE
jgi:hypothetical protein